MQHDGEAEARGRNFTLHLDKALPCPIDKAVWNPEKDLLAMVTKDQQLIMHRFNWQRLWAVSPEVRVTSLCWRPDGKALAVGHEDGTISLHDVENGNIIRQTVTHHCPVECLAWVEEKEMAQTAADDLFVYEDRTPRFFPPPPKSPAMPGAAPAFDISGAVGSMEDPNSPMDAKTALKASHQQINILCSGDRNGTICLNIFGVFLIGRVDVSELDISTCKHEKDATKDSSYRLHDPFILKVSLSENLHHLSVLCTGKLVSSHFEERKTNQEAAYGVFSLKINTALIGCRSKELHQVALQVSSIEELLEVLQVSMNVMQKVWSDAHTSFREKFKGLSQLLREHGSHANPQEECLSLLSCGLASSGLHQFLAVSLGEGGLKRLSKTMDAALRELHVVIAEHLQPVAEILAFRVGELRGISRWKARLRSIGLDEKLVDQAMENSGMVLIQIERLLRVIADKVAQYRMFFIWLTKTLRQLNNENSPSNDQLPAINSEAVAIFLKTQFEHDILGPHLASVTNDTVWIDMNLGDKETLEELALMGGFVNSEFLHNSLNQQISQLFLSCQHAFSMPSKVVSQQLHFEDILFLRHLHQPNVLNLYVPVSLACYEDKEKLVSGEVCRYVCFQIPEKTSEECMFIVITREYWKKPSAPTENTYREAIALSIGAGLSCIDLSLYKEKQLVLLGQTVSCAQAWLMIMPIDKLPYKNITGVFPFDGPDLLNVCLSEGAVFSISLNDGRARILPYADVVPPLAVSASRGLACVFGAQRRVLLYDLEEDEDVEDTEMD
ncbi:hypothetical protein KP509_02G071700 [Ceratopteris richardii]|uniref:Anaphase-promoting complex subunit 4 n=2 Tax=Ceratopteris richardii TaxID=49495 RepID=A0A8T2V704_CERRI|nr:hypothetical protein KP509_02G071700 [Ceratopteris richardii]KAH7444286.1 hypothetical protein KP509_02G071700 [Ceratopteris richardii]